MSCHVTSYHDVISGISYHIFEEVISLQLHHCEQGSSESRMKLSQKLKNNVVSKTNSSFINACLTIVSRGLTYTIYKKNQQYHLMSYHVMSCLVLYHIISFILFYIILYYITLHYITLHYITLHYITLHYIILYYIMSCHIIFYHIISFYKYHVIYHIVSLMYHII